MSILKFHKNIDKANQKEFESKAKDISKDFIRFQIEHNCRAVINNYYQRNPEYPPNILVDLICSFNQLNWRPLEEKEREELNKKLGEEAGLILPK